MDMKSLLHKFCGQKKLNPVFTTEGTGSPHSRTFVCKITVQGLAYVSSGSGNNKKEAEQKASKAFITNLVKKSILLLSEINGVLKPQDYAELLSELNSSTVDNTTICNPPPGFTPIGTSVQAPVPTVTMPISPLPNLPHKLEEKEENSSEINNLLISIPETRVEFGNWSLDNVKSRLNHIIQTKFKEPLVYTYKSTIANGNNYQIASATLNIDGNIVSGEGMSVNKQDASKRCALAISKKLLSLGLVEEDYTEALSKGAKKKNSKGSKTSSSQDLRLLNLDEVFSNPEQGSTTSTSTNPLSRLPNDLSIDVCNIDFNLYKSILLSLGDYKEHDIIGFYVTSVLNHLPKDASADLKNEIISMVMRRCGKAGENTSEENASNDLNVSRDVSDNSCENVKSLESHKHNNSLLDVSADSIINDLLGLNNGNNTDECDATKEKKRKLISKEFLKMKESV